MTRTQFESLAAGHTLMSLEADRRSFEQLIIDLLSHRAPGASISLAEVARAASPESWRRLMPAVRLATSRLAAELRVEILRDEEAGAPLPVERGAVRVARGEQWDSFCELARQG